MYNISKHDHSNLCVHYNLRHCLHCNIVYCMDCGKEWGIRTVSWNYSQPIYPFECTTTTGNTIDHEHTG
jgi:hypothetical protein